MIAGTLAGAAIPILSSRMGKNGRTEGRLKAEAERSLATDLANRFVCGVFFGAGLLHMLAESIEQIRAIPNIPSFASFLPYAIAFAGIALADICHSSVHFSHGSKNTNVDKFDNDSNERTALIRNSKSQRDISIYGSTDVDDRISHSQNQEDEIYQDSNRLLHAEECKLHVGDHNVDKMNNISNIKSADVEFQDPEESESLAIIVVFLLSVHSFVSGIALGSTSVVHDEIAILIAIVAHKWAEAFAISFSLLQARLIPTKMKIWYFVVYSSATPVGLILATVLEAFLTGTTGLWLQIIFSSLSSGSFLYIACLHMNEDFSHSKTPKFLLTCSLSLGFSIMLIVAIWL